MATNLSNLVLVVLDGVQIPIESGSVDQGITLNSESGSHSVYATTNYVGTKQPIGNFTTKALKIALDKCGVNHFALDTTSTCDFYFANKTFQGTGTGNRQFYDSTGATKISFNNGMCVFDSLTAPQGSSASASFRVLASGETDAVGLVLTLNATVPAIVGGCLDHAYVVGPILDSTGGDFPLTSWTYNSNVAEEYNYRNGLPQPAGLALSEYRPQFTIDSNDKALFDEFASGSEIIGCLTDVAVFLRKTDLCTSRVPDVTAEHISFTVASSTIHSTSADGGAGQSANYSFQWTPVLDCTGGLAPLVINTSAAIA